MSRANFRCCERTEGTLTACILETKSFPSVLPSSLAAFMIVCKICSGSPWLTTSTVHLQQRNIATGKFEDILKRKDKKSEDDYPSNSDSIRTSALVSLITTSATLSPPSGGKKGSFASKAQISGYCNRQQIIILIILIRIG